MILLENKKARFDYEVIETFTAGVVLQGWEVKSIRNKHANLRAAWISIDKDLQVWIKNFKITPYAFSNEVMEPESPKKLLLTKKEIIKLANALHENGRSLVPLKVITQKNKIKIEIALAKGKKKYEKRQVLKERAVQKEINQRLKNF